MSVHPRRHATALETWVWWTYPISVTLRLIFHLQRVVGGAAFMALCRIGLKNRDAPDHNYHHNYHSRDDCGPPFQAIATHNGTKKGEREQNNRYSNCHLKVPCTDRLIHLDLLDA